MGKTNSGKLKTIRLIIIFMLVCIFFFVAYRFAITKIHDKENDDIKTNMLIIQKKVKLINGNMRVNSTEEGLIGKKVTEIEDENIKESILKTGVEAESLEEYYILSDEDYKNMGIADELKRAKTNEYVINYKQSDVIYLSGIEINNKTKYKLKDIIEDEKTQVKQDESLEEKKEEAPEESNEQTVEE